ncbi:MAG: hypothetical protein QM500_02135 [Methylococcales bacterium]
MSIVYMGSMDDRVWRYPWKQSKSNISSYVSSVIQNIIIGKKSAVNDGYILNNHLIRDSIFKDKESLLRDIMSIGEIIIPGRKASFEELIDEQVEKGVFTFAEIPNEVRKELSSIDRGLNESGARIEGPESMVVWNGFFDLMQSLRNRPFADLGLSDEDVGEYDFKLALDTYLDIHVDGKPPSRTEWEIVLEDLCNTKIRKQRLSYGRSTKRVLMNLANEAYHYNFSNMLSNKIGQNVGVETSFTPAFSYMLENGKFDLDGISNEIPLIEIPRFNNLMNIESIEKLLSPNGIGQARLEFISALDKLNDGVVMQKNIDNLIYAAETYNLRIKHEFFDKGKVTNTGDVINLTLTTILNSFSGVNALISWAIPAISERCITKKLIVDKTTKINYTKNIMVSAQLKRDK